MNIDTGTRTSKEMALHLLESFYNVWAFNNTFTNFNDAVSKKTKTFQRCIRCALIACSTHEYSENDSPFPSMQSWVEDNKYWREVKSEIEKYK